MYPAVVFAVAFIASVSHGAPQTGVVAPPAPSGANQEYPFFTLTSALVSDTRQLLDDPEPVESAKKIGCGTKQLTEAACELSRKINCNFF